VMDSGRIVEEIPVDMPRPRGPATRTSAAMNRHCAQVRHVMHMEAGFERACPEPVEGLSPNGEKSVRPELVAGLREERT